MRSEQHERLVAWRALIDGARQQVACALDVACLVGIEAAVQQFLRLALPLGNRASRAVDVGARPIVIALEKDDARPDIDGLFVISGEVVIETGDEKFFDARRALGDRPKCRRLRGIGALWLRHQSIGCLGYAAAIMGQKPRSVNELAACHDASEHDARHDSMVRVRAVQTLPLVRVAIIECVPNISEGRRADVVAGIVDAVRRVPRGAPARFLLRRVPQPLGDHDGRRCRAAQSSGARAVRAPRSRRSICGRTRANIRGWAQSTSSRSCRSKA